MNGDTELLRRYVEDRSEAAFAELVRLHLNLVYFAALRQVGGDAHRAKDVAQTVFTDLARKAATLTGRATLTGWLHTSTRFAAAKLRRADFTRQQHEQEATIMNALLSDPDPAAEWERLRPMIDEVVHELDERDREAVLLRFFEGRPFAEIGATLRLSEDAVRMRVDRALEKLRGGLARRGVKSTTAALAVVFANQVAASAPPGLAATICDAAFAGVTAGGLAVTSVGLFMSTKTVVLSAVALAAIGLLFFEWNRAFRAESELAALIVDRDGVRAELRAERQRAERSAHDLASLQTEADLLKAKSADPIAAPKLAPRVAPAMTDDEIRRVSVKRAVLNNLRQIAAARNQFQLEKGRPPASLEELVGDGKMITRLVVVDGENYSTLSLVSGQPLNATTSDGTNVSYDAQALTDLTPRTPTPAEARVVELSQKIGPAIRAAATSYSAAHDGTNPRSPQDLLAYFATPQEGADFLEFVEAQKAAFFERQKMEKK